MWQSETIESQWCLQANKGWNNHWHWEVWARAGTMINFCQLLGKYLKWLPMRVKCTNDWLGSKCIRGSASHLEPECPQVTSYQLQNDGWRANCFQCGCSLSALSNIHTHSVTHSVTLGAVQHSVSCIRILIPCLLNRRVIILVEYLVLFMLHFLEHLTVSLLSLSFRSHRTLYQSNILHQSAICTGSYLLPDSTIHISSSQHCNRW